MLSINAAIKYVKYKTIKYDSNYTIFITDELM